MYCISAVAALGAGAVRDLDKGSGGPWKKSRRRREQLQGSRKDPNFKVATAYNMAVGDAVIPPFVKRAIYK